MLNIKKQLWIDNPILFTSVRDDDYNTFVEKTYKNISLIDTANIYGETVAHYCCYLGFIDKYYALINMGIEIKKTNNDDTLLHYASLGGKDSFLVTELVKCGTYPLNRNKNGITPIHFCSNMTTASYFNLWLQINKIPLKSIKDNYDNSLPHISARNGNLKIANYWIDNEPLLKMSLNSESFTPLNMTYHPYKVCSYS